MIRSLLLTLLWLGGSQALAQSSASDVYLGGQRQPSQISSQAFFQQYRIDEQTIREVSLPVTAFIPFRRNWGLSLRVSGAVAWGDSLASLSGITDTQVHLSYRTSLGRGSLVGSLRFNLPTGKQHLTEEEFDTLVLLSQKPYDFRTPGFGVGVGVSPGVTFALPVGRRTVAGFGIAYQVRGGFDPLADQPETYVPGNELLLTGGLDVRFGTALFFSTDLSYTLYQSDRLGDTRVFDAGDKLALRAELRYRRRFSQAWFYALFRGRSKNSRAVAGGVLAKEAVKSLPDQLALQAGYLHGTRRRLDVGVTVELQLFESSPVLPNVGILYGIGFNASFALSPRLRLPGRIAFRRGDVSGLEVSLGLLSHL